MLRRWCYRQDGDVWVFKRANAFCQRSVIEEYSIAAMFVNRSVGYADPLTLENIYRCINYHLAE